MAYRVKKLGVIVNPVAGIGGRVGLKGSDGDEIQQQARSLGAFPEAPRRAADTLALLRELSGKIEVITYPREMGEDETRTSGLKPTVIGSIISGKTTSEDTYRAAVEMEKLGVDLILFAGGDGTARDIFSAIERRVAVLGIPAGVKIHSAVYAVTPRTAATVARMFLEGQLLNLCDGEVMDIDEYAFRQGVITAKLYGYLRVPKERRYVQSAKSRGGQSEKEALQGISATISEEMDKDTIYIMGPGTTVGAIMEYLGLKNTLLGVDVIRNKMLVCGDVGERKLMDLIVRGNSKIVLSVIGGQGYILGRGNQQLSPQIIGRVGRNNIQLVALKEKLISLSGRPFLMDTGDSVLDTSLGGYWRVMTGYKEYTMYRAGY